MSSKTKPIIFTGPMVKAILEGRKSQTRRVLKPQPPESDPPVGGPEMYSPTSVDRWGEEQPGPEIYGIWGEEWGQKIPFQPGGLLWVKESHHWCVGSESWAYKATSEVMPPVKKWKSPLFMPRWASRITLEVTATRIERVQDISEEDAIAEGMLGTPWASGEFRPNQIHKEDFVNTWSSLYPPGPKSWDANPWVVVIEFKKFNQSAEG